MIWWGVVCLFGVSSAWAALSTYRVLHPSARSAPFPCQIPSARPIRLTGVDGRPFDIWLLGQASCRGVIVTCHGYYANRFQLAEIGAGLCKRGYAVVLFDLRGHGARAGASTLGVRDAGDIAIILEWMKRHPVFQSLPVGLFGLSLGAAVLCRVAASLDGSCGALVADSPFARFFPVLARRIARDYHLPPVPWSWMTWWSVQLALRRRLSPLDPLALAPKLRIPVLLIHGTADQTVPVQDSQALYEAWRGPKRLWIEPEAPHAGVFAKSPARYCDRVAQFFDEWLTPVAASSVS